MVDSWQVSDVPTPIGTFRVVYMGKAVRVVDLVEAGHSQTGVPIGTQLRKPPFPEGSPPRQVSDYFRGKRSSFDVAIDPESPSTFDRSVWSTLIKVPAGRTITYGQLARRAGYTGAARAVGGAMARNPIPLIIPCHRVVGAGGSLQGFGMGLWRKRWLLDHEGAWPLKSRSAEGPRDKSQRTLDTFPGAPPGHVPRTHR
jgi:methylated-DNA-[protein]-cysteine S-methyltransferase